MRLRTRFVILAVLAALAPLAMLGLVANHVATTRVVAKVTEVQVRTSEALADHVTGWLRMQQELLSRQARTFDLAALPDAERNAFLRLVYQQNPEVHIVALVDANGADLSPSFFLARPEPAARAGRDAVDDARFQAFRDALERLRPGIAPGGIGIGQPYFPDGRALPVMPLAARSAAGDFVLGVELDLTALGVRFARGEGSAERLALVGTQGQVLVGSPALVDRAAVAALPADVLVEELRYEGRDEDGAAVDVLAASAAVPGTGWRVVVAEPLDTVLSAATDISFRTAYVAAVAMLLSAVLGIIFASQINTPVLALRDGALAVAEGDYGRQVPGPEDGGELSELTRAFNFMSRRLAHDREVIASKNQEIEAFNQELQARVEERTRQLAEAQDRLVQSARLAAVGEMGAGLAHELNNPLAGILGLTQVTRARLQEKDPGLAAMLGEVEAQTVRCSEIVRRLQRFSRADPTRATLDPGEWSVVDLQRLLDEVLDLVGSTFHDRGVTVQRVPGEGLVVRGDRDSLAQALVQLLASLRAAAAPGSTVLLSGSLLPAQRGSGPQAGLSLRIDGPARVGEDDWMAQGMGLWASRQVLAAHGGRLVEPEEGADRLEWRIVLPAFTGGTA